MGNKVNKSKKKRGWRKINARRLHKELKARHLQAENFEDEKNTPVDSKSRQLNNPQSLVVLCEKVIHKYTPPPKRFTPAADFSIVGGKPLRKRAEKLPPKSRTWTVNKTRKEKTYDPENLVALCQNVVNEYNLLPPSEEILLPTANTFLEKKNAPKKRGRKRKIEKKPFALRCEIKRPRGRPRKDPEAVKYTVQYTLPEQSQNVRIKEEINLPVDIVDPLDDAEGFIVEIKEEKFDNEDEESTNVMTHVREPRRTIPSIVVNPLTPGDICGPSRRGPSASNLMTVVADEYQMFANSVAEQLRTLPPQRALLLQVEIQAMIENEMQLIRDES